ncbi:MAG: hypothetical protein ACREL5_02360 [Gemmatimonadales bacterium]
MNRARGAKPLRDVDTGERSLRVVLGAADYLIVLFLAHLVFRWPYWMLAIPALLPAGLLLTIQLAVFHLIHRGTHAMLTPGGYGYRRQFSEHDALLAAGRVNEAIDFYRTHLIVWPDDQEARCRLGEVLAAASADPLAAERVFLEVRARDASNQYAARVSSALIEIYRHTGEAERMADELRRAGSRSDLSN